MKASDKIVVWMVATALVLLAAGAVAPAFSVQPTPQVDRMVERGTQSRPTDVIQRVVFRVFEDRVTGACFLLAEHASTGGGPRDLVMSPAPSAMCEGPR